MLKPMPSQDAKKKLDQLQKHHKSVQVYKLSDLSDTHLRQLRAEDLTWVIQAEEDKRWR